MTYNFSVKIKTGKKTKPDVSVRSTALNQDQPMVFVNGFETNPKALGAYIANLIQEHLNHLVK